VTTVAGNGAGAPEPHAEDARQSLGPAILDDLFPEGAAFRRSVLTFTVLLALASLIAAFGLYQDSVASIIGAMVVAPLGGAIMAFAGALVTGRTRWVWISFAQVALGALMTIAIGYLVSAVLPDPLRLTPSLAARTSPNLLDLGVALAAGGAGAYVAARRTGNDALPGVAIAVSLVPPLATVGICLELGRASEASGAMLLFLTNFSAITVIACVVFVLSHANPSREEIRARRQLQAGFILTVAALLALAIPLAWNSKGEVENTIHEAEGAPVVRAWIGTRDLEVVGWTLDGTSVRLELRGTAAPPDVAPLAADLAKTIGKPVTVEIVYTPVERVTATGAP
jgi:uncharacterized hydrophobic protein (TIGR00271 family)